MRLLQQFFLFYLLNQKQKILVRDKREFQNKISNVVDRIAVFRWNKSGITIAGNATSPGMSSDQLNNPWDLALDWQDNLYVTDRLNNRAQKFTRNSKIGVTIADSFNECTGINVDQNQNFYVSDLLNHRV